MEKTNNKNKDVVSEIVFIPNYPKINKDYRPLYLQYLDIISEFIAYPLLGAGLGAVVFKVFENSSKGTQWVVFLCILFGLISVLQNYKKDMKKEVVKEVNERLSKIEESRSVWD